jgi:hypothetical protein
MAMGRECDRCILAFWRYLLFPCVFTQTAALFMALHLLGITDEQTEYFRWKEWVFRVQRRKEDDSAARRKNNMYFLGLCTILALVSEL